MASPTGNDPKERGEVLDGTVANPWSTHDVTVPLALLPVRVEARWFATASPSVLELRIRIYPDAFHVANGSADASGEVASPVARGLPSRFALVLCRGADVVGSRWGALVPEQPAVLDLDGFAAAEAVGLAMRLDVGRTVAMQLTHVAVFGLRGSNVEDDATTLSKVLRDHTADRGLRVLAPGTSTNAAGSTDAAATGAIPSKSDGARLAARASGCRRDSRPGCGSRSTSWQRCRRCSPRQPDDQRAAAWRRNAVTVRWAVSSARAAWAQRGTERPAQARSW